MHAAKEETCAQGQDAGAMQEKAMHEAGEISWPNLKMMCVDEEEPVDLEMRMKAQWSEPNLLFSQ